MIHLIQTEKFAEIISGKIKKRVSRELGVNLAFKRIEVKLFPPATLLKNVQIKTKRKNLDVEMYGEDIGLYFSLFDFFSRKFQVDTVKFGSVEASVEYKASSNEKKFNYSELFNDYKRARKISKVIVKHIEIENSIINFNKSEVEIGNSKLSLFKDTVVLDGVVHKVKAEGIPEMLKGIDLDSLRYLLHFRDRLVEFKGVSLMSGLDNVTLKGLVNYTSSEPTLNLGMNLKAGVRSLATKLGFGQEINEYPVDGVNESELKVTGPMKRPEFSLKSKLELLDSEYAQADFINISLEKREDIVWIKGFDAQKGTSKINIIKEYPIYDVVSKKFVNQEASFHADNVFTNDALYVLREHLDVLKGRLTGDVKIGWNKKGIYFVPKRGLAVEKLKLYSPDYETVILENEGFEFVKAYMLLTYDLIFKFKADLKIGASRLLGEGSFSADDMNVEVIDSSLNLKDIGPIVGVGLFGEGKVIGKITGDYDNVGFFFKPKLKDFNILDYYLGEVSGRVDFFIKNLSLQVRDVVGKYESTKFLGNADFEFEEDYFSLDIKVPTGTYSNAGKMIPGLISYFHEDSLGIDFNFMGSVKYKSTFDVEKMQIKGDIKGENVNMLSERIDSFDAAIDLKDDILRLTKFNLKKNQGGLALTGDLNLKNTKFDYRGNLSGLMLKDFDAYNTMNLGLNGRTRGEFYGKGRFTDFTSRAQFRLENSEIGNRVIKDSIFTIYNKGTDVFLSANLFEGVSISEGYISFDEKNRKKSYLNSRLYTTDPSLIAGVLSEHNYINKSLVGNVDLRAELSFFIDDLESFDLDFKMSEFTLGYLVEKVTTHKSRNKIHVKGGIIKDWDVKIDTSGGGYLESSGSGNISKSFQIDTKFKINPIFLQLVTPKLISAVGEIEGKSILLREKDDYTFHSESVGRNIDLKIDKVPGALRDISFKLVSEGEEVLLEKLDGQYGKGSINADGNIKLKIPFPEVNINGSVNGAQVPITDKTYVVVSGNSNLKGTKLPYILSGGISVLHGEVLNELEDFSKLIGLSEGYLRYIPNAGRLSKMNILNYDMDFDIFNPVQVRNTISDLKLDGSLKIRGSMFKPLISGDLNILPNVSRVFFKGNEFIMSEGRMSFLDVNKREVPEIKLAGVASVDRYEVGLAVDGRADKFGIKLSSTPSLDQGQILSLLVLGVPEDINQELDDSEREQIAVQGGVGLIVERFKLVKPIDSMLGLKFSVSPEFQEDDSSLLEGRLSSGESGGSRYKSGTKIKVQKKLLKKVDVSFSSTVGGTVEETKEMNVNYNINKNFSLEGVYELRSVEEETEENPESVGADIKWKFSF